MVSFCAVLIILVSTPNVGHVHTHIKTFFSCYRQLSMWDDRLAKLPSRTFVDMSASEELPLVLNQVGLNGGASTDLEHQLAGARCLSRSGDIWTLKT